MVKVNYRLLGHPKPNSEPYSGADWVWLSEKVIKAARWLGYIPWSSGSRTTSATPRRSCTCGRVHAPQPASVVSSPEAAIFLPDADDLRLRADLPGFTGGQHPYHLVLVGEKSSLRDDIAALAERYLADWYLPDGEIGDTHIEQMARSGVIDPRPLVLIYFADCDPSGHQMIVSVTRKLQAFSYLPGLRGAVVHDLPRAADARPGPGLRLAVVSAERGGEAWTRLGEGLRRRADRGRFPDGQGPNPMRLVRESR